MLFTFYIQGVLKFKNNSGARRLILGVKSDKNFGRVEHIIFCHHVLWQDHSAGPGRAFARTVILKRISTYR